MTLLISGEPVPLRTDEVGIVRVRGTRISLESVVYDYNSGATAEQIAFDFPTLKLADIHAVIAYYLRHQEEVQQYFADLQDQAGEVRKQIEPVVAVGEIRERLLARRADKEGKNAADDDG